MNKQTQPSQKWVSHLPKEEVEEFKTRLRISKDLFRRLGELIEVMKKENNKTRISKTSYDKPAWSEHQADTNGYERALTEVLDYLNFTKD